MNKTGWKKHRTKLRKLALKEEENGGYKSIGRAKRYRKIMSWISNTKLKGEFK